MLSAPAAIPAMIEVTLPAGFTPADLTLVAWTATLLEISSDRPACSASAITGTNPAYDTRLSSSNKGCARDQPSGNFTVSAFLDRVNQDVDTPDSLDPEGTFSINAPTAQPTGPRIEAKRSRGPARHRAHGGTPGGQERRGMAGRLDGGGQQVRRRTIAPDRCRGARPCPDRHGDFRSGAGNEDLRGLRSPAHPCLPGQRARAP